MKVLLGILIYIILGIICGKAMGFSGIIDILIWPITGLLKILMDWRNR